MKLPLGCLAACAPIGAMVIQACAQPVSAVRLASLDPQVVGGNTESLTGIAQPPGNTRDLFVVCQFGKIRVLHDGVLLAAPLLDVGASVAAGEESGLFAMAFHPQFESNGFFYVSYAGYLPGSGSQLPGVHVVRYTVNPADPTSVIPGSADHLFYYPRTDPADSRHFGGWIGFGPDGYLYMSCGDGSFSVGQVYPSQDVTVCPGKILRIDVDHDDFPSDPDANYAIPPSNPFAGSTSARPEIWAMGLRNPWRCSFDRLTGDLWIADVGSTDREEIDFQPAIGAPPYTVRNYGWPCREGSLCHGTIPGCTCAQPDLVPPLFEYSTGLSTVIGGYVYRGQAISGLQGTYFFAGLGGPIWSFRNGPAGITDYTVRTPELGSYARTTFGEGSDGELYFGAVAGQYPHVTLEVSKIVRGCPANCDGSNIEPRLNVNDFVCFLNRFAAGSTYANCDGSTVPPILTVADFACYMNEFAAGCP